MKKRPEQGTALSRAEWNKLREILQRSASFFLGHSRERDVGDLFEDPEDTKALLKSIWNRRANAFFDDIDMLLEYDENDNIVNRLIDAGLVLEYGIKNEIYRKHHLLINARGLEVLYWRECNERSILPMLSDIMIRDKIRVLNENCSSPLKQEYAVFLLILMYFNCKKKPFKVDTIEHERYFRLSLNVLGHALCSGWKEFKENDRDKKKFYTKFYNEVKVVYYQTAGVFVYKSRKRRTSRSYAVDERDKRELRVLCEMIVSSLSNNFRDHETVLKLNNISKNIMDSLQTTPLKGVPLTVERILEILGVTDFSLSSRRKREIEKILGQITTMKHDFEA